MFDRETIVAGTDLATLADELLGPRQRTMASLRWPCPEPDHDPHARRPAEINLYQTRRGEQRWHCHTCGAGGSAIDLVMKAKQVPVRDAMEYLSRRVETPTANPAVPPTSLGGPADMDLEPPRTGLDAWVARSADLLWQPHGDEVRRWLTRKRGLPEDVLRTNRIGATSITPWDRSTDQPVARRHKARLAAVLPVLSKDRAIYAQLRVLNPIPAPFAQDYLEAPNKQNPLLGLYRPAERRHDEILVTRNIIDALSANAAGYRAAAPLTDAADPQLAVFLSRLNGPLVVAFDDLPGQDTARRLLTLLDARGRRPATLPVRCDLNDVLVKSNDWSTKLARVVRRVVVAAGPDLGPSL